MMQELIRLPDISRTMQEMSKEMMKAGIIEEILEDTLDTLEPEELEEEVDKEVDKVRFSLGPRAKKNPPPPSSSYFPTFRPWQFFLSLVFTRSCGK